MVLSVNEIVTSLQGEGKYTGYPTTFVRLQHCNLACEYCDTKYSCNKDNKSSKSSVERVLSTVFKMGNRHVCITGGEPLLQDAVYCLIYDLVDRNYLVTIETNGSIEIDYCRQRSYSYCMDIKCPSSGMDKHNKFENLDNLLTIDEVKFVIKDYNDYTYAKKVIQDYPTKASLIMSPCFGGDTTEPNVLAQWIIEDKLENVRLGVQLHKVINIY